MKYDKIIDMLKERKLYLILRNLEGKTGNKKVYINDLISTVLNKRSAWFWMNFKDAEEVRRTIDSMKSKTPPHLNEKEDFSTNTLTTVIKTIASADLGYKWIYFWKTWTDSWGFWKFWTLVIIFSTIVAYLLKGIIYLWNIISQLI